MKSAVLIMSGGRGKRFGADSGKQLFEFNGKPLMFYTIEKFIGLVDQIIVIIDPDFKTALEQQLKKYKLKIDAIVAGGKERYDSVKNGLNYLAKDPSVEYVLIHDGARPNISADLIKKSLQAVKKHMAVIPAIPVKDTIKQIAGTEVLKTIPRQDLFSIQTPQCFKKELITAAYQTTDCTDCTDDSMVLEKTGQKVFVIPGEEENIKITSKNDLKYLKLS